MIRFGLRNAHEYGHETYEAKRLRLRDRAEDPRPGIDHTHDRAEDFDPATDAWPNTLHLPGRSSLAGSCSTDAAPASPHGVGAAATSAAGGPGGNRPPAAHPNFDTPEAA